MALNNEQKEIIEHTMRNGLFCGGSKDMDKLVADGLMECAGEKSFVSDSYYRVTAKGRQLLTKRIDR